MFKQKGFTLIEIMVVLVIGLIVIMIGLSAVGSSNGNSKLSIGINGMMETRCVEGYKFVIDQEGRTRQILDEFGKGVRCQLNPDPGKPGSFGEWK